jgi:WD40 repeat protein
VSLLSPAQQLMSTQAQDSEQKLYLSKNHIDSIDVDASGKRIVVGTSSLEGNTWDGGIIVLNSQGNVESSENFRVGTSMIRFSGSKLALVAKDDGCVGIYDIDKLDEVQIYRAHDDVVSCVADNPHFDSQFASCSWDGSIHLWDWKSKSKPVSSYSRAHQGHVNSVAYSHHDPNCLASVGWDGYARLWDTRQSPSTGCSGIVNMNQISSCVSFESKDKNIILVGSDAGDVSVLDLRAGNSSSAVLYSSRVHKGRVRRILSPEAESGLFVSASDDTTYTICRRNAANIEEIKRFVLSIFSSS